MASKPYLTVPTETDKMPGGIPYIVGNEAAERFSFYGMKAILFVFMTKYLVNHAGVSDVMSDAEATTYIHTFVAATYFCSIIGGFFSDAFFGKYQIIMALSVVYCLGHLVLAIDNTRIGLLCGLLLIVLGAGGIKPCVSAHVGDQFGSKNQYLLPRVFAWFYFSINFGAFLSTLLTPYFLSLPWLEKRGLGPHVAFGVPGALMFLATVVFWMGRSKFIHVPARGLATFTKSFRGESGRSLAHLCLIFLFLITFWSLFDQTASRWVEQAGKMDKRFDLSWLPFASESSSIEPTESQIQAANPALILLLIPLFSYGLYPLLNRLFGLTALRKIGIGFFVTAAAFAVSAFIETAVQQASSQVAVLATAADGTTQRKQSDFLSPRTGEDLSTERDLGALFADEFAPGSGASYAIERNSNPALFEQFSIDHQAGVVTAEFRSDTVDRLPHIGWQLLAYVILTSAEIMVSITALEFAYTQAPNEAKSIVMSLYLLTVFFGNLFTAGVNLFIQNEDGTSKLAGADYYWFFTAAMFITAVLFVGVASKYRVRSYIQGPQSADITEA